METKIADKNITAKNILAKKIEISKNLQSIRNNVLAVEDINKNAGNTMILFELARMCTDLSKDIQNIAIQIYGNGANGIEDGMRRKEELNILKSEVSKINKELQTLISMYPEVETQCGTGIANMVYAEEKIGRYIQRCENAGCKDKTITEQQKANEAKIGKLLAFSAANGGNDAGRLVVPPVIS
ncbi:MAG: hypothetical protein WC492_03345 [Candidatus Micrarchaeia archaeon]